MKNAILSCLLLSVAYLSFGQVKIYEGTETIPTYKMGEDERSPIFYTGRSVQGAAGHVYPYPSQTNLGSQLEDVTYEMVYLENEYIRVKVLPAFGGRLFSAIDKTNGHELFHTNSVIKPDLIGTLGAWVSGGIEWCFPHHHRTSTMLPSDYRLVENEDGSATIWIGETEKTMRLRGVVGMTLHPERSYIEVDYRLNNANPLTKKFLFWANVAITANDDFRTFWPPSQEIGVFHNNSSFVSWPISTETPDYGRTSYPAGVDLTWWKNHPNPVSFFFWDAKEGFIGGYDYGQKAGTVHVGDPYENQTSKLWQFGPGLQGQNARRKLTDDGKAYVELMTGSFSNNQPDYSWILPHSVKDAKNFWYPIRDIEVVKNATVDASVTLQMRNAKTAFYGFNTTRAIKNAKAILSYNGEVVAEETISIDPATPYTATYKNRKAIDEYKLHAELQDENGNVLVAYTPYKLQNPELPKTQERVKKADELNTVEELYLTGRFVEQFNRPGINPDDYYLKALSISPDDYRVNIAMGIRRVNQTRYAEAVKYLQAAGDKLQIKYYQPKEGEIYYYMGIAQQELGQWEEAYRNLARSTWYYQWHSAGFYQLALMESKKGNLNKALEHIENAYSTNTRDGRIVTLYSSLLRKLGKKDKAKTLIDELVERDPLDYTALYEQGLLEGKTDMGKWHKSMQDVDNNYLEIATHYLNAGMLEEGASLLLSLSEVKNPLIPYYLAWFQSKAGKSDQAAASVEKAQTLPLDYCFPYRHETEIVLKKALKINPEDATAQYLLGNLLYNDRPQDAVAAWEKAGELNSSLAMIWRNLAFASFYEQNDIDGAVTHMTKAIEQDNSVPLWYAELSKYYDLADADFTGCLEVLRNNVDVVRQDVAAPKTLVSLLNLNGEYDEAIKFLGEHHFRTWEGGRAIYWHYVDAYTLKALELSKAGDYQGAIAKLKAAFLYPENLEVGKASTDEKNAMIHYYLGTVYDKMGDSKEAKKHYQKSVDSRNGRGMDELTYFQAMANEKLGNGDKANQLYTNLINKGKDLRARGTDNTLIAVEEASSRNNKIQSKSYYLEALGNMGLGNDQEAQKQLETALKEYKNNLWAKVMKNNTAP